MGPTRRRAEIGVQPSERQRIEMPSKARNVIVIGTAAGGLEALDQLIGQLPTDLPASIVIVQHMDAGNSGEPLLRRLGRHQAFSPEARAGWRALETEADLHCSP